MITSRAHCTVVWLGALLFAAGAAQALDSSGSSVEGGLCSEFEPASRVERFGTSKAVCPDAATTKEDLARLYARYREEFKVVLVERGLEDVGASLARAVEGGLVTERSLNPGETLEWMTFRPSGPGGKVEALGPMCLETSGEQSAWVVEVEIDESVPPQPAECEVDVEVDCDQRTLEVRATRSARGMTARLGDQVILDAGRQEWTGALDDPFTHNHLVVASGRSEGTRTVTTYNFVIPKVCFNLALQGSEVRELAGESDSCEKTTTVERCAAPPPHCTIDVVAKAWKNQEFGAKIEGHKNVELLSAVDASGREYPAADVMSLPRPGRYTIHGRAVNETGDKAECTAEIAIKPRWTLRAVGERIEADDAEVNRASVRTDGVSERSSFSLGAGLGAALGLEYLFSDRVGLEGRLGYGQLDSMFTLDLDEQWGMANDEIDLFSLTVGPNFHLTHGKRLDLFLGPFVGLVELGTARYSVLGEQVERAFGSEFTFGAQVGLDVPLGDQERWLFHVGGRYQRLSTAFDSVELDLDPLTAGVGLGFRF